MFSISKTFHFSASHQLDGLPEDHQCSRLHGHNYLVKVELQSATLDEVGFIVDYGELAPFKQFLDDNFDHRHLNDVLTFNPTSERFAQFLCRRIRDIVPLPEDVRVVMHVSETPSSWASYSEVAA